MKINWNNMRTIILATCLAPVFLTCGVSVMAGEALQGSTDFSPSPAQPIGWRGNGTGKYPGATPPVHWSRICKQTAALKCSAVIPKDSSTNGALSAGVGFFTEWLAAYPISSAGKTNAIKDELVPGEGALAPQESEAVGGTKWKRVQVDSSYIDIMKMYGPMTTQQAAYAQSCLYSEKPMKIWLHMRCSIGAGAALWLNGQPKCAFSASNADGGGSFLLLDLQAGWNRFLFKFTPQLGGHSDFPECCDMQCRFWPAEGPRDYEEKNIAWITSMPGLSEATPVIVGDKIFTTAHPYNLVCVDKKTGKVLWIRPNGPYDAATAEDRKAKPDVFAQLDELAKKREAYHQNYMAGTLTTNQTAATEQALEDQMDKLMLNVDARYKKPDEQGEPSWWEIPTPASDGKNICVFMERGVSACYDLDGNRRWIRYERPLHQHHGFFGSPVIADGKFFILDGRVTGLDLKDGSVKSSFDLTKTKSWRLVFASLSRIVFEGKEYVLYPDGTLFRASDGKVFGPANDSGNATPVFFDGNKIFWPASLNEVKSNTNGVITVQNVKKEIKWPKDSPVVPGFYVGNAFESSPVVHDGLAYLTRCWGALNVLDLATMEILYEQVLPLDLFRPEYQGAYMGASIAMAGDYIYLLGSTGVTIVVKPGRKYEEVARNRIHFLAKEGRMPGIYKYRDYYTPRCTEYQDSSMTSTPIFEGNRMYYRGYENLYCVEQNVWAFQTADVSSGEVPLTVKFDAGKSHAMPGKKLTKYAWDFGNGQTASGLSAEHTYKAAGAYIAKLTVTDDKGTTDETEAAITVTPVDTAPPEIKSVTTEGGTNVTVLFSEPVEQASAGNAENYAINKDIKVLFAAIKSDLSEVNLITTPMAEDVKYELTVKQVKDCARKPNTVAKNCRQSFYRFSSPPDEDGYIRGWLMLPPVPIDAMNKTNFFAKEYFAGQTTCAPNKGDKVNMTTNELVWKVSTSAAVIPLDFSYAQMEYFCVAYIVCNEDIPDVRLRIGGAQDGSLWSLNGQELIRTQVNRGLGRDLRASEPVTLKKGRNVLRARFVVNGYPSGNFRARFVDKDGNPVRNYNVSTGDRPTPAAAPAALPGK